jgi:hypothetical protein
LKNEYFTQLLLNEQQGPYKGVQSLFHMGLAFISIRVTHEC